MSGVANRQPPPPGQTGDIGDVLASIRRMIAQDDSPSRAVPGEGAPATVLRLGTAAPPHRPDSVRPDALRWSTDTPPSLAASADLVAQARGLTLRSAAPASPLRLDAASRVAPGEDAPADSRSVSGEVALASSASGRDREATPGAENASASGDAALPDPAAGDQPADAIADGAPARRAAPVSAQTPDAPVAAAVPAGSSPDPQAAAGAPGCPGSRPDPQAALGEAPQAATATSILPADPVQEHAMTVHDASLVTTAPAGPAPTTDEVSTSIFSSMIREVIRQELVGNGSGEMARDLRAMILREVARAITGGDIGTPGR